MSEAPQTLPERGEAGRFLPRTPVSERSPEREKLAEAIKYLSALDRQLQRLAEARSRLDLRGKESAHAAARTALDEARQRAPEMLVAKAMGEAYDPAQTVDHAQGLLEDAQRDLDETTAADRLLADEINVVGQRRELAFHGRNAALGAVLRTSPEVGELCAHIERQRQQLHASTWICAAISRAQGLPRNFWDGILWGNDTGVAAPWKEAIARLEHDADAELPVEP